MAGLFTKFLKYWIERRVLELLRDNGARKSQVTTSQTQPLEIPVVVTRHDERFVRTGIGFFEILQLDIFPEIRVGQARAPQKVDHRLREIAKRSAHHAVTLPAI